MLAADMPPLSNALAIASIICGIAFYFFPTFVAVVRGRHNRLPIFIVNFFFGWLCIGWIVAIVWAFTLPQHDLECPECGTALSKTARLCPGCGARFR